MKVKNNIIYILTLCIFFTINVSCQTKWRGKKMTLPKISKEIISLRKDDQEYRMKWVKLYKQGKEGTEKYKKIVTKLLEIDRSNTARMKQIVEQYGWPTFEKVGKKASNIAWLIVQHADRSPLFQEKCLSLLKEELKNKQINPSNYAYLYDRVQLAKGEKQLYGTQSSTNSNIRAKKAYFQPIEDESNVQKRRVKMKIEQHIEDYALSLNFNYTVPSIEQAIDRASEFEVSYNTNIEKAKKAMLNKDYENAAEFYEIALQSDGYTKAEDYVEIARAISLAYDNNLDFSWEGAAGASYLHKAAFKGYKFINDFNTNPDFKTIKEKTLDFWNNDLMKTVKEINYH